MFVCFAKCMFVDVMIMLSLCTQCMCVTKSWLGLQFYFLYQLLYTSTQYEYHNNVGLGFSFRFFIIYVYNRTQSLWHNKVGLVFSFIFFISYVIPPGFALGDLGGGVLSFSSQGHLMRPNDVGFSLHVFFCFRIIWGSSAYLDQSPVFNFLNSPFPALSSVTTIGRLLRSVVWAMYRFVCNVFYVHV